jgi:phosphoserine phosphatase RsbU/P
LAYGGSTGRPVPFPPLPLYDAQNHSPNNHNVATYVALAGRSVNIPDVYQAAGFDFSGTKLFDESNHYRSTSCLTIPLGDREVIGVLQLLNAQDESGRIIPFSNYHQMVAESLASQAAIVLQNHILRERQQALQEFQRDLEIGRQIQASFLPDELPQPPGWQVAACFRPARLVSGDFYDAFSLPGDKLALMVADVCDKGIGAALFMALVRSLLRALIQQHYYLKRGETTADSEEPFLPADTAALLDAVLLINTYLVTNHRQTNVFATLFVGILDLDSGNLMYVNAGHVPPILLRGNQVVARLAPTGPSVGLMPIATFRVREWLVEPGDTLLVYTDGLTEARDINQAMFGEERLLELAAEPARSTAALLERIETAVEAHVHLNGLYDDLTILAVGRQK